MDDLILVSKKSSIDGVTRTGRPIRNTFSLRRYSGNFVMAVPATLVQDGDRCDFYLSASGFALQLNPTGSRAVSKKQGQRTRTVSVPVEVAKALSGVPDGPFDLIVDARPERIYFFPFIQFAKA